MKKWIGIFILLCLTLCLFACTAGAEGTAKRGLILHRPVPPRFRGLPYMGQTTAVTNEETSWTLSTEAAGAGVQYIYSIAILDGTNPPDENGNEVADTMYYGTATADTTFSYTFYEAGSYVLFVEPLDQNGSPTTDWPLYMIVDVQAGNGQNPLTAKVTEIAGQCRKSSDFATVLAINDWLCEHVKYDDSLTYYSPEAALLQGTGVCSSYTRAFQLIAAECGLQVYRACGQGGGGNHTWNTVQMDGNWYHIDVTWNDDYTAYNWFGLTDDLIGEDHILEYYAQEKNCTCSHMEDNYYLHENKLETYKEYYSEQTYPEMIQDCFDAGSLCYEGTASGWFSENEKEIYIGWPLMRAVLHEWLPGRGFTLQGEPVDYSVATTENGTFDVQITGWAIEETGTLMMPEDLETIEDHAFENTDATTVVINDVCTKIGSRAFAASSVRTIVIPGSVTEIAKDAFDGCGKIMVAAEEGTEAANYALENGMILIR